MFMLSRSIIETTFLMRQFLETQMIHVHNIDFKKADYKVSNYHSSYSSRCEIKSIMNVHTYIILRRIYKE